MTRAEAETRYEAWRKWETIWGWSNILIGGLSVLLGALVAANTKTPFLDSNSAVTCAVIAPVLTFLLTTLKPQAQAASFKTAARSLEKALVILPANGDPGPAVAAGIDILEGAK